MFSPSCWLRNAFSSLDNIQHNVESVAVDTAGAASELGQASEYQKKAGKRAACLMIILVIVTAIVLLAVRPKTFSLERHTHYLLDPELSLFDCQLAFSCTHRVSAERQGARCLTLW